MNPKLAKTQTAVLLVAGALLTLIGSLIIVAPVVFYATNDIELGADVNLLNELKAPAGMLLAAGAFMLVATLVRGIADTATSLAALIYLSYAGSRFVSITFDGMPSAGLVQAAALEGLIGLACLAVLIVRRNPAARLA